jgi:PAS domain S-box-containing protein
LVFISLNSYNYYVIFIKRFTSQFPNLEVMAKVLDAFFNVSPCGLILLNKEGEIVRCNEKADVFLQVVKSTTSDVNLPAYLESIQANELLNTINQCLAGRGSFKEITVFIPVLFNKFTFNGEPFEHEGELLYLISMEEQHNLEREQLLDQLDSYESFIKKMSDTVPGILYVFDLIQQKNVYSNIAVVSVLGYSIAEVKEMGGEIMPRLLHPEDAIRIGEHLANFPDLADGETIDLEYRMMHKDGEYRWLKSKESVFSRNRKNEITQIVGTAIDITGQKKAEENKARLLHEARQLNEKLSWTQQELREDRQNIARSEAYLRAILNSVDYGIFAVDTEWNMLFFNDFHAKYHELTFGKKPAIGGNMRKDYMSFKSNLEHDAYSRVLKGEIVSFEARIENADGESHHWGAFTYSPIVINKEIVGAVFFAQDITERKLNELELQRRERQLNSLVNSHSNYLIRIDMEGNYTFANQPFLDAFGLTEDEILGYNCMPTIVPEDHAKTHKVVEDCINNPGKIHSLSMRKPTRKGNIKHTTWEFVAIPDEEGKSYEVQCVGQDTTEKIQAEKSRNEILSRVSDGFFSVDNEWKITYANAAALKTWQLKPGNVYGKTIEEMFPEAWKSGFFAVFREAMEEQQPMVSEEYYPPYNRWYSATCYPSESGMSVYFQDITKRKLAEIETTEYAKQLNTILESITDAFFTVDKEWHLTRVNTELLSLVGSSRKQILGQSLWEVFPQSENNLMVSRFKTSLQNQEASVFQQYLAAKDVWLDVRVYPSKDGLSAYLKDITEEKKKEIGRAHV